MEICLHFSFFSPKQPLNSIFRVSHKEDDYDSYVWRAALFSVIFWSFLLFSKMIPVRIWEQTLTETFPHWDKSEVCFILTFHLLQESEIFRNRRPGSNSESGFPITGYLLPPLHSYLSAVNVSILVYQLISIDTFKYLLVYVGYPIRS